MPKPARACPTQAPALRSGHAPHPHLEELEAEVRRCTVARAIAYVCMDLAVVPGFCTGAFWNDLFQTLRDLSSSLGALYKVRDRREKDVPPGTGQTPGNLGLGLADQIWFFFFFLLAIGGFLFFFFFFWVLLNPSD